MGKDGVGVENMGDCAKGKMEKVGITLLTKEAAVDMPLPPEQDKDSEKLSGTGETSYA